MNALSSSSVRLPMLVVAALVFAIAASGCDRGDDSLQARFSATFEGDVQKTIEGRAGIDRSEALNSQLQTVLPLLLAQVPDSLSVPDSLLDPENVQVPDGTALFLSATTEGGFGDGFSFFFPGEGVPEPGEYEIGQLAAGPVPPLVVYTRYDDEELLLAPIVDGSVQVRESEQRRLRGEFQLETDVAGVSALAAEAGSLRVDAFDATITGRFSATADEQVRPPLPFPGGFAFSTR